MAMFSATLAGHPNQADVVDETAQKAWGGEDILLWRKWVKFIIIVYSIKIS
jgi:hypothetical protein